MSLLSLLVPMTALVLFGLLLFLPVLLMGIVGWQKAGPLLRVVWLLELPLLQCGIAYSVTGLLIHLSGA